MTESSKEEKSAIDYKEAYKQAQELIFARIADSVVNQGQTTTPLSTGGALGLMEALDILSKVEDPKFEPYHLTEEFLERLEREKVTLVASFLEYIQNVKPPRFVSWQEASKEALDRYFEPDYSTIQ